MSSGAHVFDERLDDAALVDVVGDEHRDGLVSAAGAGRGRQRGAGGGAGERRARDAQQVGAEHDRQVARVHAVHRAVRGHKVQVARQTLDRLHVVLGQVVQQQLQLQHALLRVLEPVRAHELAVQHCAANTSTVQYTLPSSAQRTTTRTVQ